MTLAEAVEWTEELQKGDLTRAWWTAYLHRVDGPGWPKTVDEIWREDPPSETPEAILSVAQARFNEKGTGKPKRLRDLKKESLKIVSKPPSVRNRKKV